jgi:integrase
VIYRRGSSWAERVYNADGSRIQRSFPTKRLAVEFEATHAVNKSWERAGLAKNLTPIKYERLASLYLEQYDRRSKKWFEEMLAYSLARWGSVYVKNLDSALIAGWLTKLELSPKTKRHLLACFRQVLAQGVEWGYLDENPTRPKAVKAPPAEQKEVFPFESWDEVMKVASNAGRFGPLIRFACATGLRPQEWIALRWGDVAKDTIFIESFVVDGKESKYGKTDQSRRSVVLSVQARDALRGNIRGIRPEALVFPAAQGGHIRLDNFRRRVWKPALLASEVRMRPVYQCRHTYATLALQAGCSIEWISNQLGHSNVHTTLKHYARFLPGTHDRQLALLNTIGARASEEGEGSA